jgi:hypothetical protein
MIHDLEHLVNRTVRLGLIINLLAPATLAAVAFTLHEIGIVPTVPSLEQGPSILFFVLGALAISELIAAFVLRRALFSQARVRPIRDDPTLVEQWLVRSSIVIFAVGASPMVYGAVLYLLSGDTGQLAFFGIITLLAYRLFRPSKALLEELLEAAERP